MTRRRATARHIISFCSTMSAFQAAEVVTPAASGHRPASFPQRKKPPHLSGTFTSRSYLRFMRMRLHHVATSRPMPPPRESGDAGQPIGRAAYAQAPPPPRDQTRQAARSLQHRRRRRARNAVHAFSDISHAHAPLKWASAECSRHTPASLRCCCLKIKRQDEISNYSQVTIYRRSERYIRRHA